MNKIILWLKNNWKTILIIILVLLLIYLWFLPNFASNYYNMGVNDGKLQSVISLYSQVDSCKIVTIGFNNQTLDIVAVKCIS